MTDSWEEKVSCAIACPRCGKKLGAADERILSVYNDEAICMACKEEEEGRSDYAQVSKKMIDECLLDTDNRWVDPAGYCYHHFYPYKCD
jgi:hypothetical protein